MMFARTYPPIVDRPPARSAIVAELGLAGGARLRGGFDLHGARSIEDRLNNWPDPLLLVECASLDGETAEGIAVIQRHELLWARPLGPEPLPSNADGRTARPVRLLLGAFDLRGTVRAFPDVEWLDFLVGLGQQFFVVHDARLTFWTGSLVVPSIVVNAPRVEALLTVGPA